MTHYALATSPFGNFAVSVRRDDSAQTIESFTLTPIGSLDAVPTTTSYWSDNVIDHDALAAEAERQLAAGETSPRAFRTAAIAYTINGKRYTDDVTLTLRKTWGTERPHLIVDTMGISADLSASACTKLGDWWQSVRDSIVTDEFVARSQHDAALGAERHARRAVEEARAVLASADANLAEAESLVEATSAVLDAVTA